MATETLIERILAAGDGPSSSTIDALHELLDDATIEASTAPRVAWAARLVGLSTHTLRYYEREGLVRPAPQRLRVPRVRRLRPAPPYLPRPDAPVRHDHDRPQALHQTR
ncbi:MerR family DNA-binding transcriptional regulator [Micromonospora chalcea]|uniref:MerR family DNA-binding transcriptional regulator n=1 Tax=Micromonospora chalcea TaxID=1874 RepID=UPI0023798CC5|nr:MerR family DNA-binding transcriptional regulator [Micromonospora chalcea]WDQ00760.1 MerR family DNA-binding transcriptional regulator [Micromonospora chalcea]